MSPSNEPGDDGIVIAPTRRKTVRDEHREMPAYALEDERPYQLYVSDHVLIGIRQYAREDLQREVGGVLLGRHFSDGRRDVVEVSGYLPLPTGSSSAVHFDFDEEALVTLHARLQDVRDQYVVGWFHSHVKGDPFMSGLDITLHRQQFPLPWYVSCVVTSGEWSMPVCFWRIEGERLIEIREHYVHMTRAYPMADQSRRFLRASEPGDRPIPDIFSSLRAVLGELGLTTDGALAQVLSRLEESAPGRVGARPGASPLTILLDLATAIGTDVDCAAEVAAIRQRMGRVRFQEQVLFTALLTIALGPRIVVGADRAFTFEPGDPRLCGCDFTTNTFWPILVTPQRSFMDASLSPAGRLWMLDARGELLCIPGAVSTAYQQETLDSTGVHCDAVVVDGISPEPRELMVASDRLWIRTSTVLHEVPTPRTGEGIGKVLSPGRSTRLPTPTAVMVKGTRRGTPGLAAIVDGALTMWDWRGKFTGRAGLPTQWSHWRLAQACATVIGLFVLFDDGAFGQLVRFDPTSLDVVGHYVPAASTSAERIYSLTDDELGRVFVKRGSTVSLLLETGSPSPGWLRVRDTNAS